MTFQRAAMQQASINGSTGNYDPKRVRLNILADIHMHIHAPPHTMHTVHIHAYTCIHIYTLRTHIPTYTHTHIHTHHTYTTHTHIHAYTHPHIHTIILYTHTRMHIHTYTHTHTHIHTCTHTQIYTYAVHTYVHIVHTHVHTITPQCRNVHTNTPYMLYCCF